MSVLLLLLTKILYIVFFLSILNIIRNLFLFAKHVAMDTQEPYKIKESSRLLLAISIAYLLMTIFMGRVGL